MKKIITLLGIVLSINCFGQQNIFTEPKQTINLRIKDVAWWIGKQGEKLDSSLSLFQNRLYKIIEDTVTVYGINNSLNRTARVDSVPAEQIVFLYTSFATADYGEVFAMGSNTAERNFIGMQVKLNNNPTIQYYIGITDANSDNGYWDILKKIWYKRRKYNP